MSGPFLLAQLSDLHVGADWGAGDPLAQLAAAVAAAAALRPDAVVVTGDVAEHGSAAEYEQAREALAAFAAPVHVLAGNHDRRAELRRALGLPGAGDEPVQHAVDLGPLRLVALDTTLPGEDRGELDEPRLAWLDAALAAAPDVPTVVAMHHAPVWTGVRALDELGLPAAHRRALAAVVERHPQVRRLVAGHVHRTIAAGIGGRPLLVAPSTYLQARLDFRTDELELVPEPGGFAVHALHDGEIASHVQPVRPSTSPRCR